MDKNSLTKVLREIDEEVYLSCGAASPKPIVVIVGGAAFLLRDLTTRAITHDIDVYMADQNVRRIMGNYPNVNGAVAAFADQIPYNFEDRLVHLSINTQAIDYTTPSTEDLVVMKL